jgi:hypothetical protein
MPYDVLVENRVALVNDSVMWRARGWFVLAMNATELSARRATFARYLATFARFVPERARRQLDLIKINSVDGFGA